MRIQVINCVTVTDTLTFVKAFFQVGNILLDAKKFLLIIVYVGLLLLYWIAYKRWLEMSGFE